MLKGRFELNFEQVYLDGKNDQVEEQLEDELASFAELLRRHYEFKLFLEDPRIAAKYKKKCLRVVLILNELHIFALSSKMNLSIYVNSLQN